MKRVLPLLLAALLTLSACGQKTVALDLEKLAADLLSGGGFTDELTEVDGQVAALLYGIEGSEDQRVYMSSGATAEEIGLFAFADDQAAQTGLELVRQRLEQQKADFTRYIPAEIPKLESAVAERYGRYVLYCVSGDGDALREIIKSYT